MLKNNKQLKCSKCNTIVSLWWAILEIENLILCSICYQQHKCK
jgi:hypothetical protein